MGAEATLGKRCAKDGNTFHHDVTARGLLMWVITP